MSEAFTTVEELENFESEVVEMREYMKGINHTKFFKLFFRACNGALLPGWTARVLMNSGYTREQTMAIGKTFLYLLNECNRCPHSYLPYSLFLCAIENAIGEKPSLNLQQELINEVFVTIEILRLGDMTTSML
tara:strand:+ start:5723 stop:6121 length:399 start_codon:yes stop_codon:yes gene_type:complete